MTTKVQKWGNSYAIRIPKSFIDDLKLKEGVEVDIVSRNQSLVFTKKKQKEFTLSELLEGITPENYHKEVDWGNPVGGEIW